MIEGLKKKVEVKAEAEEPIKPNFDEEHNILARKLYQFHVFNDLLSLQHKLSYKEYLERQEAYDQHETSHEHIAFVQLVKEAGEPLVLEEISLKKIDKKEVNERAAHNLALSHKITELGREFTASGIEMAIALNAHAALDLDALSSGFSYCGISLAALPALFIPFKCLVAVYNNEEVTIRKKELKELITSLATTALFVGQLILPPLYLVRRGFEFVKSAVELFQICYQRHALQKKLIPLREEFNSTAEVLERKIQRLEVRQKEFESKKAELKAHVLQDATGGESSTEMAERLARSRKLTIETQDLATRVTRLKDKVKTLYDEKQKLANKINTIEYKLEAKYSYTNVVKKTLSVSGSALALAGGCVALLCANPITGPVIGAALVCAACAIFVGLLIHKVYEAYQAKAGAKPSSSKQAIITHPAE
jgi:hypothetical protein